MIRQVKCDKCGHMVETTEFTRFCSKCGSPIKELKNNIAIFVGGNDIARENKKNNLIVFMLVMLLIIFFLLVFSGSFIDESENIEVRANVEETIEIRDIRKRDYEVKKEQGFDYYKVIIIPKIDIEEFTVELELTNNRDDTIYEDEIKKKELKKGIKYEYTFKCGFRSIIKSYYAECDFSGKVKEN